MKFQTDLFFFGRSTLWFNSFKYLLYFENEAPSSILNKLTNSGIQSLLISGIWLLSGMFKKLLKISLNILS